MKAEVVNKISTYVFYVLMALSAAVLLLFYLVGYDNMTQVSGNMYTDPQNLDALMFWMYALLAMSVICVLIFTLVQFIAKLRSEPKSALKSIGVLVLFAAMFGVAYALADGSAMVINGTVFEETDKIILTDVFIYVQYVLITVTVLCTVVSLSGLFKAMNKIKV